MENLNSRARFFLFTLQERKSGRLILERKDDASWQWMTYYITIRSTRSTIREKIRLRKKNVERREAKKDGRWVENKQRLESSTRRPLKRFNHACFPIFASVLQVSSSNHGTNLSRTWNNEKTTTGRRRKKKNYAYVFFNIDSHFWSFVLFFFSSFSFLFSLDRKILFLHSLVFLISILPNFHPFYSLFFQIFEKRYIACGCRSFKKLDMNS